MPPRFEGSYAELQEALAAAETERDAYKKGCDDWSTDAANLAGECSQLTAKLSEMRKKALEAFGALCDHDAAYCGCEIRITCSSHSDAIERMRVAREALAAIRALAEEVRT